MEVILKQDVQGLGHKDDLVKVKDGYGRNYLIPKGLAITATENAKKVHAEILRQRQHKEERIKKQAIEMAEKMKGLKLTIGAKTSSTGRIFGSVNTIQIAEAIKNKGFDVDRKNIFIEEDSIKEVGNYKATVKLHKEVEIEVDFEVIAE
jgi:large subunit ribosomal protein L9